MSAIEPDRSDRLITAIDDRRPVIVDLIRGARRHITLSLFRCNDAAIFRELESAVARGVAVDVLVTSRAKGGRKKIEKLWQALDRTGAAVQAYTDPVVKYHPKYMIVDDGPALVATLNFTKKCFKKTCDALVLTHDPAVVADLRRLWAADAQRTPIPTDLSERLIIGPERARRQFTALLEQATRSIRLLDAKLSDPDLVSLLNGKRDAGVTVEIFSASRVADMKSHGKILLLDDRIAVVGSLALAALSLDFRREVSIVVDAPAAVQHAADLFTTLRNAVPGAATAAEDQAVCRSR